MGPGASIAAHSLASPGSVLERPTQQLKADLRMPVRPTYGPQTSFNQQVVGCKPSGFESGSLALVDTETPQTHRTRIHIDLDGDSVSDGCEKLNCRSCPSQTWALVN